MRFHQATDNEWLQELVDHRVVATGLAGLETREGLGLLDTLLLNAAKVDGASWLEWLTSGRGLIRLHALVPDPDWIAGLTLPPATRRMLFDEGLLPCRLSAGSWICASLKGEPEWRRRWEQTLGARLMLVAPTLAELKDLRALYQGGY
ncbi:MAG: hypothetical protein PHE83_14940 [Opitutaceae bacterium]|nr:hypothetical protein [Opitutaceae bacterium]